MVSTVRRVLKKVPGLRRLVYSALGQAMRYRWALHFEDRECFTFTQFFRLPAQLDALTGPVLNFLGAHERSDSIRIVIIGCSNGAGPYTVSSVLLHRWPNLAVTIDAYDISADLVEFGSTATYRVATVFSNPLVNADFVSSTFDTDGDRMMVKPRVAQRVHFHRADATNPGLRMEIPAADIVFAQNIMCNLRRPTARRVFENVAALLKPRSALFIDGMDLDMRERYTRLHDLEPLTYALERIHDEARLVRGERYPDYATGLEPFSHERRDGERRYSTIFLRGTSAG